MDLYEFLTTHHIGFQRFDHAPVYTVDDVNRLIPDLPGTKVKNLFVRDAKGKRHFLIVVPDHLRVDLKTLSALTKGYSNADIAEVCRSAKLTALKAKIAGKETAVTTKDMSDIIRRRKPSITSALMREYDQFMVEYGERR